MRISSLLTAVACFLNLQPYLVGQSQPNQKIAEGQYSRFHGGKPVEGSNQTWALIRTADGKLVLQDEFNLPPDTAAQFLAGLAAAGGSRRMSPELRRELEEQVTQTGLNVTLSADKKPESFKIKGKKLVDGRPADVLACSISEQDTKCKNSRGSIKSKHGEHHEFLYGFPFPMLMMPLVAHAQESANPDGGFKVNTLAADVKKPVLVECDAKLTILGQESFKLGDRTYPVNKYDLQVCPGKSDVMQFTLWSSPAGLVMALETNLAPGERLELVQLKIYSEM